MPIERTNLVLGELSLVPKGANPLAKAPLFKAMSPEGGEYMTTEVIKMSEEMDKKIKAYMKAKGCDRKTAEEALMKSFDDVEALKAENERLRKSLIADGYVIKADTIEKKAPDEFIEYEGEKINKADVPAPILKALEAAEIEKRDNQIKKQAEEKFPNLKEDLAVALVKADFDEDIMSALAALDELFGEQMNEIGKSGTTDGDMTDPNEKLNALAKKYAEEHDMQFAKAYAAVVKTDAGKALTKEIYKKD